MAVLSQEAKNAIAGAIPSGSAAAEIITKHNAAVASLGDGNILALGDDSDQAIVNRATTLNAATALTGVIVGTPVTAAIPANSLIVGNVTADGDQVFVGQTGGNSQEWMRYDASAKLVVFNEASGDADLRVETDGNANALVIDGGTDSAAIGSAVVAGAGLSISNLVGRATVTSVGTQTHRPSATFNDTASANTIAIQADHFIGIMTHTATNARTYTDCASLYIAGAPVASTNVTQSASWALFIDGGATRLDGTTYIGDVSNATVTLGLTINQGANDDAILELKSSDVSHAGTTITEADTYGKFSKWVAANGGLMITGVDDAADQGLVLRGVGTTATATRSTSGTGPIMLSGSLITSNDAATVGADKNLLCVRDLNTTRFIMDSDGDSFQDVGTAWTNFDAYDDAALLTALSVEVSRENDPIKAAFGEFLAYSRKALEAAKLVSFNDGPGEDRRPFVNMSRLTMVLVGAVRQQAEQIKTLVGELAIVRALTAK